MNRLARLRAERIERETELARLRDANKRAWRRLRIGVGVPVLLIVMWVIWYMGYLTGALSVS